MLLSGVAMAQTSHWTQTFNAVSNQSFNRIAMFQGVNDNPDGPDFIITSLFTVGQTQHSQIGSNVYSATAQPRYSFGGNPFNVASGMVGVKAMGYDVYPDPTVDQFYDEVWLAGHKITGSPIQAQYSTGTIRRRTLWLEDNFTELRALAACQYLDISVNKKFGGEGIVAVGTALVEGQAFISTSTDNAVSWTDYEHTTAENATLKAVKYASEDVIYAVGGFTTGAAAPLVLKSVDGGANWVELTVGLSGIGMLNDLAVAGEDSLWAVGNDGKIIHTNNGGATWTAQTSNNINHLLGVFFLDAQRGWLAGGTGTIMKTTNGGQTWSVSPINSTLHFSDIAFVNEDEGVVIAQNGTIFSHIGCSPITGNLTIDGPSSLCADGQATYTIQIGQQNVTDYIWEYNGGTGTLTNGSVTITAPSEGQGNPTLTIYGSNECSQGAQFSYAPAVVGTPDPFTITGTGLTCVGAGLAYSVESTGIPVTWDFPNGWVQNITFPNNNGGQFTAGESGTISFTRDNGCFTRTETLEVNVLTAAPVQAVMADPITHLCPGEQATVSLLVDETTTFTQFLFPNVTWSFVNDTDTSFFVTAQGISFGPYDVTVNTANACGSTSTVFNFTRLYPLSEYAIIGEDNGLLGTTFSPLVNYQWLLNGDPIPGETDYYIQPQINGGYSLQVTYIDHGCAPAVGNTIMVTVVGVDETTVQALSIYPNPATSVFTMDGLTAGSTITLMDAMGRTVSTTAVTAARMEVPVAALSTGIYMVQVMDGNEVRTARLMVN